MKLRFAAALFALALQAAVPTLRELAPRGGQRGKTFMLYLRGVGLSLDAQVRTTLPATFSRVTPSQDPLAESAATQPDALLPYLVSLKADAPTGLYPIRVTTAEGISNVLLFSVGDLPEIQEVEAKDPKQSNDSPGRAQQAPVPVVINGTLTAADIDNYHFSAKAGQRLVFEVEARRAGSAIDPVIEIFDADGRELARNDDAPGLGVDARVEVTFPRAGEYRVAVHDAKYSEQEQNFYRLQIGSYQYADGLFPLGWRRGESMQVTLLGGNLARPVRVSPDVVAKTDRALVRVPSSPALPLLFALSDEQELLEPESGEPALLPEHAVMNGRISKPGEVDRYRVRVQPGQHWVFELTAASLGTSRLDAILTVYDTAGKKLASADDAAGLDPVLPFTAPKGVNEITLAVEDLLGRGGETYGYRLEAKRQYPDFVAELATPYVNVPAGGAAQVVVNIQRRGYDGEIRLKIPDLPPGFTVGGGHVPPEAAAQSFNNEKAGWRTARSVLTITAEPDVKPQALELSVLAEAETPEGPLRRYARGPGMITAVRGARQRPFTAHWLGMQLPLATTSPLPLTIATSRPLVRFAQGFEYNLQYEVRRSSTAKGPVKVTQLVAGDVGNLRILKGVEADKNPDQGSFMVDTNFATPSTTFDMLLTAQTEIDGKPVTVSSPAVEIQVAPGYEITLAEAALQVTPGGKAQLAGKVRREPTFEGGVVRVEVEDLPDYVKCPAVEVPADQKDFVLACEAAPESKPGTFPVRISSVAPNTGHKAKADYRIPDLKASLVVAGTQAATR